LLQHIGEVTTVKISGGQCAKCLGYNTHTKWLPRAEAGLVGRSGHSEVSGGDLTTSTVIPTTVTNSQEGA